MVIHVLASFGIARKCCTDTKENTHGQLTFRDNVHGDESQTRICFKNVLTEKNGGVGKTVKREYDFQF